MADIKITDLPEVTEVADEDQVLLIDVSDNTAGPAGTDKRSVLAKLVDLLFKYDVQTAAELEAASPVITGRRAICRDHADANYILAAPGYTALPGDLTAANGRVWVLQDVDNVRSYGAITDGVDCSAVIETALNSERSQKYKFRGNFTVDLPTNTNGISDITLDCYGAHFDCSNMYGNDVQNVPDALFNMAGSIYGTTSLAQDALKGDMTLTVTDGTQVKEGAEIYILSDQLWYREFATDVGRRFIATVKDVSGNVVTLMQPLPFDFQVSGFTVSVESWDQIENINILGGKFFGGNYRRNLGNGVGIGVAHISYFRDLTIKHFHVDGFENIAYRPNFGRNAKIQNGFIRGHAETYPDPTEGVDSGFYGVFFSRVLGGQMRGVLGVRTRHLQDSSSSFDLSVVDCESYLSHRPPYGSHSGTGDTTYINCKHRGTTGGIQWRGWNLYITRCDIDCGPNSGNGIYDSPGSVNDIPAERIITDCDINVGRNAVNIAGTTDLIKITGGTLVGGLESASYAAIDISADYMHKVEITTDAKQGLNAGICIKQSSTSVTSMAMFRVYNSTIKSDTNLIRFQAQASAGQLWIESNVFDSTGLYDLNINNTQNFERFNNNFKLDGSPATRT